MKCIRGAFNRAKKKAGIDSNHKLPPYAFRHAFVTTALNAGGDLKGVSEMVGHSRTETTTGIYQHAIIYLHRGIVENLPPITIDGLLGGLIAFGQWTVAQLKELAKTSWEAVKTYYYERDSKEMIEIRGPGRP